MSNDTEAGQFVSQLRDSAVPLVGTPLARGRAIKHFVRRQTLRIVSPETMKAYVTYWSAPVHGRSNRRISSEWRKSVAAPADERTPIQPILVAAETAN